MRAALLPLIAVTMGDPCGIGPEIVLKALADRTLREHCRPVVFGSVDVLRRVAAQATLPPLPALPLLLRPVRDMDEAANAGEEGIAVWDVPADAAKIVVGVEGAEGGRVAVECVRAAVELALAGTCPAIATAPLNKAAMRLAGFHWAGHTELLAELSGTKKYTMLLVTPTLRVAHVSTHVSLREAIERVRGERIGDVVALLGDALRRMGFARPRIAVAGLNPHAGEGGLFGQEEAQIIGPAVAAARRAGHDASGPYPPDTVFYRASRGDFDGVVAMYHDQGHIPVKLTGFETGVNVSLGLPFVRTSVDHGTAFDIAGKGIASPSSLTAAILLAARMAQKKL